MRVIKISVIVTERRKTEPQSKEDRMSLLGVLQVLGAKRLPLCHLSPPTGALPSNTPPVGKSWPVLPTVKFP